MITTNSVQIELFFDNVDFRRGCKVGAQLNFVSVQIGHDTVQSSLVLQEFLQRLFQSRFYLEGRVEKGIVAVLDIRQLLFNRGLDLRIAAAVAFDLTDALGP